MLVIGDFNIAPNPWDGLVNGGMSPYNKEKTDRGALHCLMEELDLVDLGARDWGVLTRVRLVEFSSGAQQLEQFRCDLALVSRKLADSARLTYDHGTRDAESGRNFSDHSALIVDLPIP